jgi:hypothetical protein
MTDATQGPSAAATAVERTRPPGPAAADHDRAWVEFAAIVLALAAVANIVGGIAAIGDSEFFNRDASHFFADVETFGVVILVVGVLQALAVVGIWARSFAGTFLGVLCAGASAFAQLLMMPAHPEWALAIFAIDVLVMYALITHGELDL